MDDFGTGYSSLSYLRSLPIDILKIDRSFVEGVIAGPEQSAVARAVVKLARTFNLRTVAEGIEQPEQAAELLAMGADMGQGYLYARSLRADAMAGSWRRACPFPSRPSPSLPQEADPAANSSTMRCASSSRCCTAGDFMK